MPRRSLTLSIQAPPALMTVRARAWWRGAGVAIGEDVALRAEQLGVVEAAAAGAERLAVEDQLEREALGVADLALVVEAGADQGGVEVGHLAAERAAGEHAVARHGAEPPAVGVVEAEAERGDEEAAVVEPGLDAQEAGDRAEDAAGPGADRHDAGQRRDQVRRGGEQHVALGGRLADQAELAGLEIFQAAMHQPRRSGGGAGREVVALDEQAAHALGAEVAEGAAAVDAAADDDDVELFDLDLHLRHRGSPPSSRRRPRPCRRPRRGWRAGSCG